MATFSMNGDLNAVARSKKGTGLPEKLTGFFTMLNNTSYVNGIDPIYMGIF